MKKSFWGYNIQEVDANVGFLESQNVKLERQVKQLAAELEKVKKELEEASAAQSSMPNSQAVSENSEIIANLQHKLADSEREKQELSAKIASLNSRLSELTVTNEPKEAAVFEDIGNIFRLAYADMHVTKQKTKDHLKKFLEQFWQKWSTYEELLSDLSEQVLTKQKESKESFISYADYVLQVYGDMESSNREFDSRIAEIVERKADIANELNNILAELDKDFDDEDKVSEYPESDPVKEENNVSETVKIKYSILDTVRKMHEGRIVPYKTQESDNLPSEEATANDKTAGSVHTNDGEEAANISPNVNIRNII